MKHKAPNARVFRNKATAVKKKVTSYTVSGGVSRIRSYDYSDTDWRKLAAQVKKDAGGKCQSCGSDYKLEAHHITPLSRGGKNTRTNLICLCHDCHEKRHRHMRKRR